MLISAQLNQNHFIYGYFFYLLWLNCTDNAGLVLFKMLSHIESLTSNDLSHHSRSRRAEALTGGEIDTHVW